MQILSLFKEIWRFIQLEAVKDVDAVVYLSEIVGDPPVNHF